MAEYRTGHHWGVTIVREARQPTDGTIKLARDQLVAVVVNGDQTLAERICALLNGTEPSLSAKAGPDEDACGKVHPDGKHTCQRRARHDVCISWQSGNGSDAWVVDYDDMADRIDSLQALVADSCTCDKHKPDPACPVHQGRRARGPKPPPLGRPGAHICWTWTGWPHICRCLRCASQDGA